MCDCIATVNAALRPRNTALATNMTFNNAGKMRTVLPIPTRKIAKRGELVHLACRFCPICGEKLDNDDIQPQPETETSELRNAPWKCVDCGNSWMSAIGGTCPTCGGELK
jgi:hypothetical protein